MRLIEVQATIGGIDYGFVAESGSKRGNLYRDGVLYKANVLWSYPPASIDDDHDSDFSTVVLSALELALQRELSGELSGERYRVSSMLAFRRACSRAAEGKPFELGEEEDES